MRRHLGAWWWTPFMHDCHRAPIIRKAGGSLNSNFSPLIFWDTTTIHMPQIDICSWPKHFTVGDSRLFGEINLSPPFWQLLTFFRVLLSFVSWWQHRENKPVGSSLFLWVTTAHKCSASRLKRTGPQNRLMFGFSVSVVCFPSLDCIACPSACIISWKNGPLFSPLHAL